MRKRYYIHEQVKNNSKVYIVNRLPLFTHIQQWFFPILKSLKMPHIIFRAFLFTHNILDTVFALLSSDLAIYTDVSH